MFYNGLTVLDEHLTRSPPSRRRSKPRRQLWTFKLRKDVTFHDGSPLTSADVVYSLQRHKDPEVGSIVRDPRLARWRRSRRPRPDEVQITLSAPECRSSRRCFATYPLR